MKKGSNRMIRINDEIQKEISAIIRGDLKDPRMCHNKCFKGRYDKRP